MTIIIRTGIYVFTFLDREGRKYDNIEYADGKKWRLQTFSIGLAKQSGLLGQGTGDIENNTRIVCKGMEKITPEVCTMRNKSCYTRSGIMMHDCVCIYIYTYTCSAARLRQPDSWYCSYRTCQVPVVSVDTPARGQRVLILKTKPATMLDLKGFVQFLW